MQIFLATERGLFELVPTGGAYRICCPELDLADVALFEGYLYVCSPSSGVYEVRGGNLKRRVSGGCWRLRPIGETLVAAVDGPALFDATTGDKIVDLSEYSERLGWRFLKGPAHITDIATFKGKLVASVEDGSLLAGDDLKSLAPTRFWGDLHALLADKDRLYISTSTGIYYTQDLEKFNMAVGPTGYTHAVVRCGGYLATQEMSRNPLWTSIDGLVWRQLPVELPKPAFGTTNLACIGARAVYAVRQVYVIDLARLIVEKMASGIPLVLRVSVI
ncbi:MAG: hypothetical protein QXP98_06060 [Thermoproteus sp.]